MSEERLLAGRFALETVIGRGGMGTVWRAWDALLDRPVAVKEIHLPPGADHPELRARVLREARLAGKLNHPGAVTVFDAIEADDRIYIVMELVEAATLQDLVESEGPLPPARTVEIASRVLDVLQAAHRLGIVHRDVKPSNIMVAADGSVKLTDFGIARLDDGSTATASSIMVGSPAYMAPEHVRGRAVAASDLWALGVTLYFAVEGKSPYLRSTAGDSLAAVLSEEPPAPVRAGEALARLLGGLMAKPVDDRPTIERIRAQLNTIGAENGDQPTVDLGRPQRDPWLVVAGVICLSSCVGFALLLFDVQQKLLPGVFTLSNVMDAAALPARFPDLAARQADAPGSRFAGVVSWATDVPRAGYAGTLADGGLGLAGLIVLALLGALVVTLPVAGLLLFVRRYQVPVAAVLAGSSPFWLWSAGYFFVGLTRPIGERLYLAHLLFWGPPAVASLLALIRARRAAVRLGPRQRGLAITAGIAGIGCLALGAFTHGWPNLAAAALFVPGFAISVFAIVATPRATGIRILAAWTAALAIRTAVDLAVLLDFAAYGFIDEHGNPVVAVPSEFKASIALTCFAVLIGAALTVGRSIRERPRSWTTPH
ncbi:serine/threonine-protein kinase [Saccharopolyspora shandongensis]|uniref:serine/threonine-protein kinase n=1 Tax=Saccharopolyspora shandongensis TaxID=418495 RepID=UPI00341FFC2E